MDVTGYSINQYKDWDHVPISIIAGVVGGGAIILTLVNFVLARCGYNVLCEDIIFGASGLLLDFEVNNQQGNKEATSNSHKRKVPFFVIHLLFVLTALVFVCTCATFWDTFLVEESFGCNPGLDCFPLRENDLQTLSYTPIQSCSDYELIDNVTIVCYRFVFKYAEGFGDAGGILFLAINIMKMYTIVLFWAVDSEVTDSLCGKIKYIMKWIVGVFVLASPVLSCIAILIASLSAPIIYSTIFKTKSQIVRFVVYYVTYFYLATVGIFSLFAFALYDKLCRIVKEKWQRLRDT